MEMEENNFDGIGCTLKFSVQNSSCNISALQEDANARVRGCLVGERGERQVGQRQTTKDKRMALAITAAPRNLVCDQIQKNASDKRHIKHLFGHLRLLLQVINHDAVEPCQTIADPWLGKIDEGSKSTRLYPAGIDVTDRHRCRWCCRNNNVRTRHHIPGRFAIMRRQAKAAAPPTKDIPIGSATPKCPDFLQWKQLQKHIQMGMDIPTDEGSDDRIGMGKIFRDDGAQACRPYHGNPITLHHGKRQGDLAAYFGVS